MKRTLGKVTAYRAEIPTEIIRKHEVAECGDWIVTEEDGDQHAVSDRDFRAYYMPLNMNAFALLDHKEIEVNQAPLESLKKQIEIAPADHLPTLLTAVIRACIKSESFKGKDLAGVVKTIEKQVRGL